MGMFSPLRSRRRIPRAAAAMLSIATAALVGAHLSVSAAPPAAHPAKPAVKVPALDPPGLKRQIAARKGKVIVLNLWATWCGPCKDEFPDLVKAFKADKAKGLDLVTISFDDVKDVPDKVAPFLQEHKLTTGTFVNRKGTDFDTDYLKYLEPKLPEDEAFAIPRTYIFDRKGKLVTTLVGGQTFESLQKAITPVLKAK